MADYISKRLRLLVASRARRRCEYCRSPLAFATEAFSVEHIFPRIRGGETIPENLALSCSGCNGHKYDKVEGFDSVRQLSVPLFHPRHHIWRDHFVWDEHFERLIGLSATGRATIETLHLNREGVVNLRRVLFLLGLHPPEEDNADLRPR